MSQALEGTRFGTSLRMIFSHLAPTEQDFLCGLCGLLFKASLESLVHLAGIPTK
jgi:hypothetical protein